MKEKEGVKGRREKKVKREKEGKKKRAQKDTCCPCSVDISVCAKKNLN